ncbi:hypothetical protein BDW59DRAFT_147604 [Aspergillus cavernicola]|uniref:Uncharacterized protein n=1 Tax=Aspergillus cavernicola TaxID=176166 RepID=A0ABR4IBQ7_9EURO
MGNLWYSSPAVECLSLLDETPSGEDPDFSTSRLKYGCTCGQCTGGYLSPRMKLALLNQAGALYDILYSNDDGQSWVADNDIWFRYVP